MLVLSAFDQALVPSLFVAGILALDLRAKALGLIFGIVELGKPVSQLTTADEELKSIG